MWGRERRGGLRPAGQTRTPGEAPRARRRQSARLVDARLWIGIAMIAGSMVVGARVMAAADDTVRVWSAGHDLSVGAEPGQLVAVSLARSAAVDLYVPAEEEPTGRLRWPIRAGELLPRSAIEGPAGAGMRRVTVAVDPLHAPTGLTAGDLVDVWSTPRDPVGPAGTDVVLPGVVVDAVSTDAIGMGGEIGVVLAVPADAVASVVAAGRGGDIDLVSVPVMDQSPAGTQALAP